MRMSWLPALAFSPLLIIGCGESLEGITTLHVADLVALRSADEASPIVFDANGADFRTREGIIPGAVLLSSYAHYDVEKELPARKDARLVFYCADSH
jgi:hypothetical protein